MDKIPEYLRETVDWFMGKTRRRPGDGRHCSSVEGNEKLYLEEALLEMKLSHPQIESLVELPIGVESNEWIASHSIGFFEHINLIYGTISECCTSASCPDMMGPGHRHYMWLDDRGKKARLSAPQYIDYIMTFVQNTIYDDSLFPTKHGVEFPPSFDLMCRKIHKLLLHALAHIYHAHYREVVFLQLHTHLNMVFAHFVEFNHIFQMVDSKEMEIFDDLIYALKLSPAKQMKLQQQSVEQTNSSIGHSSSTLPNNNNFNETIVTTTDHFQPKSAAPSESTRMDVVGMEHGGSMGKIGNNDDQMQSEDSDVLTPPEVTDTSCPPVNERIDTEEMMVEDTNAPEMIGNNNDNSTTNTDIDCQMSRL